MCSVDCLDQEHLDVCEALEGDSEVLTVIHAVTAGRHQGGNSIQVGLWSRRILATELAISYLDNGECVEVTSLLRRDPDQSGDGQEAPD